MTAPISFPSTTANFALPLLFSGQAQKELSINQTVSLLDALVQSSVDASLSSPPLNPEDGSTYRVLANASDIWAGKDDQLAVQLGGAWHFVAPKAGLRLFDRQAGTLLHYDSTWKSANEPALASGGTVIDAEARQMLLELVEALRILGIFPQSP